jgi:hypothetical protein
VSTTSKWDQVIDQAIADIDKHQHAAPVTKAPSHRPPGGWVKPVTYAPVKVSAEDIERSAAFHAQIQAETDRVLGEMQQRLAKMAAQPSVFVETPSGPVKVTADPTLRPDEMRMRYFDDDPLEARFRHYMNIGPTIQGTFYIPPDPGPDTQAERQQRYTMQRRAASGAVHAAGIDPLDAEHDGVRLAALLIRDHNNQREKLPRPGRAHAFTPAQRAAVSAHWSAQLRAKVEASEAADAARRPSVVVDLEDP